jgi:hypothetical protein
MQSEPDWQSPVPVLTEHECNEVCRNCGCRRGEHEGGPLGKQCKFRRPGRPGGFEGSGEYREHDKRGL